MADPLVLTSQTHGDDEWPSRAGRTGTEAGDLAGARLLIVEARFYDDIADALLAGAARALEAAGVHLRARERAGLAGGAAGDRDCARRRRTRRQALSTARSALGCVIRGETLHFEIVSFESARALMDLSVAQRIPIGNGIITVDTEAQARERALWTRATRAAMPRAPRLR